MGVQITCPHCGKFWHVRTVAQTQKSKCFGCGTVITVPPHELRTSNFRQGATGEHVRRTRSVRVRSMGWTWLIVVGGAWWGLGQIPDAVWTVTAAVVGVGAAVWFLLPDR